MVDADRRDGGWCWKVVRGLKEVMANRWEGLKDVVAAAKIGLRARLWGLS